MKSKSTIPIALVAAFVIGFYLGHITDRVALRWIALKLTRPAVDEACSDFSQAAELLIDIRSGETNKSIEDLEESLNDDILIIGKAYKLAPESKRDPQWMARIRWLQKERIAHPWTNYSFNDNEVSNIFSLASTNRRPTNAEPEPTPTTH